MVDVEVIKTKIGELKVAKAEKEALLKANLDILDTENIIITYNVVGFKIGKDGNGEYVDFIVVFEYATKDDASCLEYLLDKIKVAQYDYVVERYTEGDMSNGYSSKVCFRYYI